MILSDVAQGVLAASGLAVLGFSVCKRARVRRWGYVIGLLSEPAWIYASWTTGQWGVLLLSAAYTVGWLAGILTHFKFKLR